MPELPEVETVMRTLRGALDGQVIARIVLNRADLRWPVPADLPELAQGRRILSFRRRGKYILMRLDGGTSVLLHLGMSGRIHVEPRGTNTARKHEHVVIETTDGVRAGLVDPRRFGAVLSMRTEEEDAHPLLAGLGVEPLGPDFGAARLAGCLAGRRSPIKTALLDQKLIAGLGNIYVCEALFRAGVHPETRADTLLPSGIARLAEAIPAVLEEAIASGGSTLRDYVRPDGEKGGFQELHRVYGREGEPCPACPGPPGCGGVRRLVQSGRSSFFCPLRQRSAS